MYQVVFEYIKGKLIGGRYRSEFASRDGFDQWWNEENHDNRKNTIKIVAQGVTDSEAISLCAEALAKVGPNYIKAHSTDPETGEIDPDIDALEAMNIAMALARSFALEQAARRSWPK